jgi:hypothetical protein
MRPFVPILMLTIVLALTGEASAWTMDVPMTPAYVKENPQKFSIRAEKRDDGLIHFTITYRVPEPRYLVARIEVRDQGSIVLDSSFPAFVREKTINYYIAVSPRQLFNARFELSESGIDDVNGTPIPWVGGTNYQIHLADFAPKASKTGDN